MTKNYRGYWYNASTNTFTTAASGNSTGAKEDSASWLSWEGYWGDEQYENGYDGQECLASECKYVTGPTGPVAKNLGRTAVCKNEDGCTIFDDIHRITKQ